MDITKELLQDQYNIYNIISSSFIMKRNMLENLEMNNSNIYIINSLKTDKQNTFFFFINLLIKKLGLNQFDDLDRIKKKIQSNKNIEYVADELINFFKYYFNKSKVLESGNQNVNDLYYKLFFLFKDIFKSICSQKNSIIFINNYENLDYWSRRVIESTLQEEETNTICIIYSKVKIKKNFIDKYIYSRQKNDEYLPGIENSNYLKLLILLHNKLSFEVISDIFHLDKRKINQMLAKYKYLYLSSNKRIYILDENAFYKIKNSIGDEYKQKVYGKIIKFLEKNNIFLNFYNYSIYIEYYEIQKKYKEILRVLDKIYLFLEKFNANEDLIQINHKRYKLDKCINRYSGKLLLKILSVYTKVADIKRALDFINTIPLEKYDNFYVSKVKLNENYYNRILGNYSGMETKIKKRIREAFENRWWDLYFDWIGELIFFYYTHNKNNKINKYLDKLDKNKDKVSSLTMINNYWNIKAFIAEDSDFERAEKYYSRSINLAGEIGEEQIKIMQMNNIGSCLYKRRSYFRAYKILIKALKEAKKSDYKLLISLIELNLAYVYLELGELDKMKSLIDESLELSKFMNFKKYIFLNYLAKSLYFYHKGEFPNSIFYFNFIIENSQTIKNEKAEAISRLYLAQILYEYKNNIHQSLEYFHKGMKMGNILNLNERFKFVPTISRIYSLNSGKDKAIKYLNQILENEEMMNIDNKMHIQLEKIILRNNLPRQQKIEKIKQLLAMKLSKKHKYECYYYLWKYETDEKKKHEYRDKLIKFYSSRQEYKYKKRLNNLK
ncbi:MAG: tetratricopeptide repeat protein [Candidatus Mcinerneyibacterium aminivorans]|uniref:Tetratricopeptide repeat protein n=1 Tax=Candidatus Mcinerneyibacterium aminivorans TaxID=2703815 RepID=A0A5D0MGH3_9BACT|nr:MAG: tetratricopeptide repeat protein [Candidatus Mcinerneyibacterium aminivorans]